MSKRINKAFAKYRAKITPKAVKKTQAELKARGIRQSAADIRWSAAMTLRDALEQETGL